MQNDELKKHVSWGYAILRITLGVNIFIHGFGRLDNIPGFAEAIGQSFANTFIPVWLATITAYPIPIAEFIIGLFLILGIRTYYSAIAGALLMIPLVFGINLQQKWSTSASQLIYCLIYFVLIALSSFDKFNLDSMMFKKKE